MNHHDDISAAVFRKLNYLGRQAESGIATNTAMVSSTKERGAEGARREKYLSHFLRFVMVIFQ